eukprot:1722212-Prymnesium_polylepis.1
MCATASVAISTAACWPTHARGPAPNGKNAPARGELPSRNRSGSKASGRSQLSGSRPSVSGDVTTALPRRTATPPRCVSSRATRSTSGAAGYRRSPSSTHARQ